MFFIFYFFVLILSDVDDITTILGFDPLYHYIGCFKDGLEHERIFKSGPSWHYPVNEYPNPIIDCATLCGTTTHKEYYFGLSGRKCFCATHQKFVDYVGQPPHEVTGTTSLMDALAAKRVENEKCQSDLRLSSGLPFIGKNIDEVGNHTLVSIALYYNNQEKKDELETKTVELATKTQELSLKNDELVSKVDDLNTSNSEKTILEGEKRTLTDEQGQLTQENNKWKIQLKELGKKFVEQDLLSKSGYIGSRKSVSSEIQLNVTTPLPNLFDFSFSESRLYVLKTNKNVIDINAYKVTIGKSLTQDGIENFIISVLEGDLIDAHQESFVNIYFFGKDKLTAKDVLTTANTILLNVTLGNNGRLSVYTKPKMDDNDDDKLPLIIIIVLGGLLVLSLIFVVIKKVCFNYRHRDYDPDYL